MTNAETNVQDMSSENSSQDDCEDFLYKPFHGYELDSRHKSLVYAPLILICHSNRDSCPYSSQTGKKRMPRFHFTGMWKSRNSTDQGHLRLSCFYSRINSNFYFKF